MPFNILYHHKLQISVTLTHFSCCFPSISLPPFSHLFSWCTLNVPTSFLLHSHVLLLVGTTFPSLASGWLLLSLVLLLSSFCWAARALHTPGKQQPGLVDVFRCKPDCCSVMPGVLSEQPSLALQSQLHSLPFSLPGHFLIARIATGHMFARFLYYLPYRPQSESHETSTYVAELDGTVEWRDPSVPQYNLVL